MFRSTAVYPNSFDLNEKKLIKLNVKTSIFIRQVGVWSNSPCIYIKSSPGVIWVYFINTIKMFVYVKYYIKKY
jgi:hypothetical protein